MAVQTSERTSERQKARQNLLVTLYARTLLFFDENRNLAYGILAGLVLLGAGIAGYVYYQNQQAQQAQRALGQVVSTYEQGNYQVALDGTESTPGLIDISNQYGGTAAGNLATYYAADALYQTGQYDRALTFFQRFEKDDDVIGASAYAAQAAIHESRENYDRAGELYQQAATFYESDFTTPRYLLSAGRAYEQAGSYAAARSAYERIQNDYPDTPQAEDATRFLARIEARQQTGGTS
jgi:tetratricopeptide (TPR) repeat protein